MKTACGHEGADPVRKIELTPDPAASTRVRAVIYLADFVASCCVQPDLSSVEFQRQDYFQKELFELVEGRPGHRLEAAVTLPTVGEYRYRVVARILGKPMAQEGTYTVRA